MANGSNQAKPHQIRPPSRQSSRLPSSFKPCTTATSPWAGGSASAGNPHIKRDYAQIVADAQCTNSNPTLIQFKLTKICIGGDDNNKPQNLTFSQFGEFLFDQLKIDPNSCLGIDLSTGRYDTRELLLKNGTDISPIVSMTPHIFRGHEIKATSLTNQVTKVTFRHVPLYVPDEELLHLCCHYGELVDGVVHRDPVTIGNANKCTLPSSTRWIEVNLSPGKAFHNYYWLSGPRPGEVGRRVTVLHQNQPRQCSWCFKYAPSSRSSPSNPNVCHAGGDGKTCKSQNTPRAKMSAYIEYLKTEGYTSLKDQFLAPQTAFPSLHDTTTADVDSADHISEEEAPVGVEESPAEDTPIEIPPETPPLEEEKEQPETQSPPESQPTEEEPPEEGESFQFVNPKPRKSPHKKTPQSAFNAEKKIFSFVKGDYPLKDITKELKQYAGYALREGYVMIDPRDNKAKKTTLGTVKFLGHHDIPWNVINGVSTQRARHVEIGDKILDIATEIKQKEGDKKKKARLHSESSPTSNQSQSKSQRTGSLSEM